MNLEDLSYNQKRLILKVAALDEAWLAKMKPHNRSSIFRANAREKLPITRLNGILVTILNYETASAAKRGRYNEWPSIKSEVLGRDIHSRPFYAMLRSTVMESNIKPVVWTNNCSLPNRPRTMRALLGELKLAEYWPNTDPLPAFPAVKSYRIE